MKTARRFLWGIVMEKEIQEFTEYLETVKRLSRNTVLSYRGGT